MEALFAEMRKAQTGGVDFAAEAAEKRRRDEEAERRARRGERSDDDSDDSDSDDGDVDESRGERPRASPPPTSAASCRCRRRGASARSARSAAAAAAAAAIPPRRTRRQAARHRAATTRSPPSSRRRAGTPSAAQVVVALRVVALRAKGRGDDDEEEEDEGWRIQPPRRRRDRGHPRPRARAPRPGPAPKAHRRRHGRVRRQGRGHGDATRSRRGHRAGGRAPGASSLEKKKVRLAEFAVGGTAGGNTAGGTKQPMKVRLTCGKVSVEVNDVHLRRLRAAFQRFAPSNLRRREGAFRSAAFACLAVLVRPGALQGWWHAGVHPTVDARRPPRALRRGPRAVRVAAQRSVSTILFRVSRRRRGFGSIGDCLKFEPDAGSFEVNPPFDPVFMGAICGHMERLLANAGGAMSLAVIVVQAERRVVVEARQQRVRSGANRV